MDLLSIVWWSARASSLDNQMEGCVIFGFNQCWILHWCICTCGFGVRWKGTFQLCILTMRNIWSQVLRMVKRWNNKHNLTPSSSSYDLWMVSIAILALFGCKTTFSCYCILAKITTQEYGHTCIWGQGWGTTVELGIFKYRYFNMTWCMQNCRYCRQWYCHWPIDD
jgi:hypothetical protein